MDMLKIQDVLETSDLPLETSKRRLAIFIDGDNFFNTSRFLGWKINFRNLVDYFMERFDACLALANYYMGTISINSADIEEGTEEEIIKLIKQTDKSFKQRGFISYLCKGTYFSVITKAQKFIKDAETGRIITKCNFDVELAVDAVLYNKDYDIFVLASGDGDFTYLINTLKILGKEVYVISYKEYVAADLQNCVGHRFINVDDIREFVEKK